MMYVNMGFRLYIAPPAYLTKNQIGREEVCSLLKSLEDNRTPTMSTLSLVFEQHLPRNTNPTVEDLLCCLHDKSDETK